MLRLTTRLGHPTFVDLPWETPLSEWHDVRIVTPVQGIHRHVVNFIAYGGALYAMKELPGDLATREYGLLRELDARGVSVVEAVGTVTGRTDAHEDLLDSVLITRHLDYSLPYRALFQNGKRQELWLPLLDSLALLLVRIHIAGFYWGDCSLSNALFRRDAGSLAATVVDAETGEVHPYLSDGHRLQDLMIAEVNVAGELLDIAMGGGWADDIDPAQIGEDLVRRYEGLWAELTREQIISADTSHEIDARVRRLNQLGFDVSEVVIEGVEGVEGGAKLRFRTAVVEAGHHHRELLALTALDAHENQARRLLNDIRSYRAVLERRSSDDTGTAVVLTDQLAAMRWLAEVFTPTIECIPLQARGKLEPAELFHQILEHRWFMSEDAGRDIGTAAACADYVATVLSQLPDERHVVLDSVPVDPMPVDSESIDSESVDP